MIDRRSARTYQFTARRRQEAFVLSDLARTRARRRPRLPVRAWWWRRELCIASILTVLLTALTSRIGVTATTGVLVLGTALTIAAPATRRVLVRLVWWLVTPHRIRTTCVEARIHTRDGKLPSVLRATMTRGGERVLLLCPAGVTADDLRLAAELFRSACWTPGLVISSHSDRPHLVSLETVRCRPAENRGAPVSPPPARTEERTSTSASPARKATSHTPVLQHTSTYGA